MFLQHEVTPAASESVKRSRRTEKSYRRAGTLLRPLLLLAFAALLFARMPDVLQGRLWAEEGSIFFAAAAALPWWSAIWMSHSGYLNFVANAAPVIAVHVASLENAPFVTTAIRLLFQCCPAVILLYSRDAWLRSPPAKVAALLLICTAPMVSEVWLQSMHSQFHLAICCGLILAFDIPVGALAIFTSALLVLAAFCGPASAALLPWFFARAAIDRSPARLFQALLLSIGTFSQFAFFYTHQPGRVCHITPLILILDIYVRQILSPLAGWNAASIAAASINMQLAAHLIPWIPLLACVSFVVLFAVALWRRGAAAFIWLFLAAGSATLVGYYGAFDTGIAMLTPGLEGRYVFVPQVLASLALLGIASGSRAPDCWIAGTGIAVLIAIGTLWLCGFTPVRGPAWNVNWINHGPDWHQQVALWRRHPDQPIEVWPDGWMMTLPAPK